MQMSPRDARGTFALRAETAVIELGRVDSHCRHHSRVQVVRRRVAWQTFCVLVMQC